MLKFKALKQNTRDCISVPFRKQQQNFSLRMPLKIVRQKSNPNNWQFIQNISNFVFAFSRFFYYNNSHNYVFYIKSHNQIAL